MIEYLVGSYWTYNSGYPMPLFRGINLGPIDVICHPVVTYPSVAAADICIQVAVYTDF